MTLRPYQQQAVNSAVEHLRNKQGNPCIVIPTGGGKTHVINELIRLAVDDWGGRVLMLAHVKELIEQTRSKLDRNDVGIYSAGLNKRDRDKPIILAGIQSVYQRAAEFGAFNLAFIDECHMVPPSGEGMYRTFIDEARVVNPKIRFVGLTATPYRTGTGMVCGPDNILNEVCYEASIPELINDGYLSKLRSKQSRREIDTSGLRIKRGEFVSADVEELMDSDTVVDAAVSEILAQTIDRYTVLVFASSIRHAMHLQTLLPGAEIITSETPNADRADRIKRFREKSLKFLVNVNVLSVGFDAPNVDCVALLRPTLSPGLYYQQVGRGLRLSEGKENCLVLDFAGNIKRHGPIDQVEPSVSQGGKREGEAPTKTCPECLEILHISAKECRDCGHVFVEEYKPKHNAEADEVSVLSQEQPPRERKVRNVRYAKHLKRDNPEGTPTLRVDYMVDLGEKVSEWVCIEHDGFAGNKAKKWWQSLSNDPFPESVDHAVAMANAGSLAIPNSIVTKKDGKWDRVAQLDIDSKPPPTWLLSEDAIDPDEIPF